MVSKFLVLDLKLLSIIKHAGIPGVANLFRGQPAALAQCREHEPCGKCPGVTGIVELSGQELAAEAGFERGVGRRAIAGGVEATGSELADILSFEFR